MPITVLLWIAVAMAVWALFVIAVVRFFMGAHIDDDKDDEA
jgi:hypothetical protein